MKTRYWVLLAAFLFLFGCWLGHRAGVTAAYIEMHNTKVRHGGENL